MMTPEEYQQQLLKKKQSCASFSLKNVIQDTINKSSVNNNDKRDSNNIYIKKNKTETIEPDKNITSSNFLEMLKLKKEQALNKKTNNSNTTEIKNTEIINNNISDTITSNIFLENLRKKKESSNISKPEPKKIQLSFETFESKNNIDIIDKKEKIINVWEQQYIKCQIGNTSLEQSNQTVIIESNIIINRQEINRQINTESRVTIIHKESIQEIINCVDENEYMIYNYEDKEFNKKMKQNLIWNIPMEDDIFVTFLHEQGENGNFDPVEAYNNTLTKEEKDDLKIKLIKNNLNKKDIAKALKGPSEKVKKMIEKKDENKQKKILDEDKLAIERLTTDIKNMDDIRLSDIAARVINITTFENKLYIYELFTSYIKDEKLLKILFIEICRNIEIKDIDNKYKKLKKFMISMNKTFEKEMINFQLIEMEDLMPPHSPFEKKIKKVDDWQKNVMNLINSRASIFIDAPTSAGKTVCSTYCACVVSKVLFIVPTKELANQVAGTFRKMKTKKQQYIPIKLITSDNIYQDENPIIFIGTPIDIEKWLNLENSCLDNSTDYGQIDTSSFEYIIVDEIHQMNNPIQGPSMQRIIKRFDCPMLGISATIGNPDEMTEWMRYLKKDTKHSHVERVSYNKRFINQQKHLWNGTDIEEIHPCAIIDLNYLQNDKLLDSVIAMTPKNCFQLYNMMKKVYNENEIEKIDPNTFFTNKCITLDNCKNYEILIKQELTRLSKIYINETNELLEHFIINEKQLTSFEAKDIYLMLKKMQKNNMFPTLAFKFEPNLCQELVYNILNYMEKMETVKYPNYKLFREIQNNYFKEMNIEIQKIDEMKFNRLEDVQDQKDTRIKQLQTYFLDKFINDILSRINNIIKKYKQDLETSPDNKIYQFYIKYYTNEINKIQSLTCLSEVNIYAPHPEFTFSDTHITESTMRDVKHLLHNFYKQEKSIIKITYNHPFLRCIERGIILYLNILPIPFQRVAQMLIGKNLAPVSFSDESLAYGVNYPIRSVILVGSINNDTIDNIIAHQASGRSGRRGLDTKGHVVYCGVNWKPLCTSEYLQIKGVNPDNKMMVLPKSFNKSFNDNNGFINLSKISLNEYIMIKLNSSEIKRLEQERLEKMNYTFDELIKIYSEYNLLEIYRLNEYSQDIHLIFKLLDFLKNKMYSGFVLDKYLLFELITCILDKEVNQNNDIDIKVEMIIKEFKEEIKLVIPDIEFNMNNELTKIYKMLNFSIYPDTITENIKRIMYIIEFLRILYNQRKETKKTNKIIEYIEIIFIDLRNLILKNVI